VIGKRFSDICRTKIAMVDIVYIDSLYSGCSNLWSVMIPREIKNSYNFYS